MTFDPNTPLMWTNLCSLPPRVRRTLDNGIRTFTGRMFWPLDPWPEEIFIEDIAHALSQLCRFTGHTYRHYSVADHSLRVSFLVEKELSMMFVGQRTPVVLEAIRHAALWGLLHDASEAYLQDLPSPLKHAPEFGPLYRGYETRLMLAVTDRFELDRVEPTVVKEIDLVLLAAEMRDLMTNSVPPAGIEANSETIFPLNAIAAEYQFLMRFASLILNPNQPNTKGDGEDGK